MSDFEYQAPGSSLWVRLADRETEQRAWNAGWKMRRAGKRVTVLLPEDELSARIREAVALEFEAAAKHSRQVARMR